MTDRVVVVTAGGAGIGAATARRFARQGAAVVVADISGKRAAAVAGEIETAGGRVAWIKMDAAEPAGVQATVRLAVDTYGRLDVMVNNAGLSYPAPIIDGDVEEWRAMLETNVLALLASCRGYKAGPPAQCHHSSSSFALPPSTRTRLAPANPWADVLRPRSLVSGIRQLGYHQIRVWTNQGKVVRVNVCELRLIGSQKWKSTEFFITP
jgi:NAD(P)-dependent dehydrogenase (short-subunit alcohol dehydrogenase family)